MAGFTKGLRLPLGVGSWYRRKSGDDGIGVRPSFGPKGGPVFGQRRYPLAVGARVYPGSGWLGEWVGFPVNKFQTGPARFRNRGGLLLPWEWGTWLGPATGLAGLSSPCRGLDRFGPVGFPRAKRGENPGLRFPSTGSAFRIAESRPPVRPRGGGKPGPSRAPGPGGRPWPFRNRREASPHGQSRVLYPFGLFGKTQGFFHPGPKPLGEGGSFHPGLFPNFFSGPKGGNKGGTPGVRSNCAQNFGPHTRKIFLGLYLTTRAGQKDIISSRTRPTLWARKVFPPVREKIVPW